MKESNNQRLLVLRLSALGDVAIAVPVLLALRRTYPSLQVIFATKSAYVPVLEGVGDVTIFPVSTQSVHRGLPGLWKLRTSLLKMNPDAVADLHNVLRTRILKLFFAFSGIPFQSLDKGRGEKKRLTATANKSWKPLKRTFQRYASVFAELGYPVEVRDSDVLPPQPWPAAFGNSMEAKVVLRIGVAPFAAHSGKCYPEGLMQEVIRMLSELPDSICYLFGGGPEETRKLREWEAVLAGCVSVAGKGSLKEELALISNLDLMISMDSGNGHLAAMFGVPVLTLWGVTHPYAGFAPFGQPEENSLTADRARFPQIPTSVYGNKVPPGYENTMETIPPEQVVARASEILGVSGSGQATTTGERERK